jgi:hypothetical protein
MDETLLFEKTVKTKSTTKKWSSLRRIFLSVF